MAPDMSTTPRRSTTGLRQFLVIARGDRGIIQWRLVWGRIVEAQGYVKGA